MSNPLPVTVNRPLLIAALPANPTAPTSCVAHGYGRSNVASALSWLSSPLAMALTT
jgi:hypothetical protein